MSKRGLSLKSSIIFDDLRTLFIVPTPLLVNTKFTSDRNWQEYSGHTTQPISREVYLSGGK